MTTIAALLPDIDRALARGGEAHREAMLRKMTDLFLQTAPEAPGDAANLIDEIILHLADEIEERVRVQLAQTFARQAPLPIKTTRALAHDTIEVASPLLLHASALPDETLVSVAVERGEAHRLAIARRSSLTPPVTDALVEHGESSVLHAVTANQGAHFSDSGFERLVSRSVDDNSLQRLLSERKDLPMAQIRRLIDIAGGAALGQLRRTLDDVDAGLIGKTVGSEIDRVKLIAEFSTAKRNYAGAYERVAAQHAAGKLAQQDVLQLALDYKIEETICALSLLTKVSIRTIEGVLERRDYDQFLILCKSLGFTWSTVRVVMNACFSSPPPPQMSEHLLENYEKLGAQTAERIVKFLSEREAALHKGA